MKAAKSSKVTLPEFCEPPDSDQTLDSENSPSYFTPAEIKKRNIVPKGKRIRKSVTWESRWSNYSIGTRLPVIDDVDKASAGPMFFYDLARDKVMHFDIARDAWVECDRSLEVPKLAVEITKDGSLVFVGIIEDEDKTPSLSFEEFLRQ